MPRAAGSTVSCRTSPPPTAQAVLVVVVVSSSRPSSPRTTSADAPRPANTSAITGASRGSAHPTRAAGGCAGLVSGPSTFIAVGTPSSRRAAAACRIAGWNTGAKQNPMPTSATHAATPSGGRSIATPSASSTSAAPLDDEAARLPCLTTGAPAAATTTARHRGDVDGVRLVAAGADDVHGRAGHDRPAGRAAASPRPARRSRRRSRPSARSATRNPASWAGVASAESTRSITQAVSAASRCSPRISLASSARPGVAAVSHGLCRWALRLRCAPGPPTSAAARRPRSRRR